MNQRRYLQMVRTNQFGRVYGRWKERKFRHYIIRYSEEGMGGLLDKRLDRISPRRAHREEVEEVVGLYKERYSRCNIRHFYEAYTEELGAQRADVRDLAGAVAC